MSLARASDVLYCVTQGGRVGEGRGGEEGRGREGKGGEGRGIERRGGEGRGGETQDQCDTIGTSFCHVIMMLSSLLHCQYSLTVTRATPWQCVPGGGPM